MNGTGWSLSAESRALNMPKEGPLPLPLTGSFKDPLPYLVIFLRTRFASVGALVSAFGTSANEAKVSGLIENNKKS